LTKVLQSRTFRALETSGRLWETEPLDFPRDRWFQLSRARGHGVRSMTTTQDPPLPLPPGGMEVEACQTSGFGFPRTQCRRDSSRVMAYLTVSLGCPQLEGVASSTIDPATQVVSDHSPLRKWTAVRPARNELLSTRAPGATNHRHPPKDATHWGCVPGGDRSYCVHGRSEAGGSRGTAPLRSPPVGQRHPRACGRTYRGNHARSHEDG
jgi:hypothetical protein